MSTDPLQNIIKDWYLPVYKAGNTQRELAKNLPRTPIPVLGSSKGGLCTIQLAREINAYLSDFNYRLDPLNGVYDFYNHPEVSENRHKTGNKDLPMDCDDFAAYAVGSMLQSGVKQENTRLWTLVVYSLFQIIESWTKLTAPHMFNILQPVLAQIIQSWANHVICGFSIIDGNGVTWTGVIDTNTAARAKLKGVGKDKAIFWFKGHPDDLNVQQAIVEKFSSIYNVNYYKLIADKYPFL